MGLPILFMVQINRGVITRYTAESSQDTPMQNARATTPRQNTLISQVNVSEKDRESAGRSSVTRESTSPPCIPCSKAESWQPATVPKTWRFISRNIRSTVRAVSTLKTPSRTASARTISSVTPMDQLMAWKSPSIPWSTAWPR